MNTKYISEGIAYVVAIALLLIFMATMFRLLMWIWP